MDLGSSRPLNTILSMLLANVAPSLKIFSTFFFFFCNGGVGGIYQNASCGGLDFIHRIYRLLQNISEGKVHAPVVVA